MSGVYEYQQVESFAEACHLAADGWRIVAAIAEAGQGRPPMYVLERLAAAVARLPDQDTG